MAGRWRLDKRQLEACAQGRCRRGVSWRRAACASAPALAGGVRVGAGVGWSRPGARRGWRQAACASRRLNLRWLAVACA
ncbi:hypothetical protein GUJ93_ZPchr0011g28821 [Zizania palustris]|uniref:Uncharacterized protein n=1 Tax=Zizania palustris TaxID=103762 RepID=A0A8J6BMQ5_ZIZPA|nr:hypothetical protein GUJ93_ZPchr0011g28821 [Zizania palustris]